ncbi:MAG: hypothetical protein AAFN40_13620 [Cyanobacteria bacterium J06560_6]
MTKHIQIQLETRQRLVLMTLSPVREEPDEVESLMSGFEAKSGKRFPGLG